MKTIKIQSKIELKDYIKLMYKLTYNRPITVFITIIGIFQLLASVLCFLGVHQIDTEPYFIFILGVFITVFLPFSIYRSSVKTFKSNKRLSEAMQYEFSDEIVKIHGDSFNTEFTWSKIYKILELKDWIIIYQDKLVANILPKKALLPEQLNELKTFMSSLTGVKVNLKK